MRRYNPKEIEPKWQKIWDEKQIYKADLDSGKPKYFAMSMLNYPSGAGIHIGHAMNYTISDVMARFARQKGYETYHPVGWDAFGLPAENYAIKSGISPQKSMTQIIPNYHKQYKAMGWSNDWSREISTHEPEYYKWTQWIFAELFRAGLVYQDSRMQWWCPVDNTVLADEQVTAEGKCWRHDNPDDPLVEKREIKQWFFKITDYADELLEAIDGLDWTNSVKQSQKNWIGKSIGAVIDFQLDGSKDKIQVFTTRADTIFGTTYLVLAPEHPLVNKLSISAEAQKYIDDARRKSEVVRAQEGEKNKTGVFTGVYAINPASQEKIPIWIADYVLMSYGTGAIMAVPAHDERDYIFAKKYKLPIKQVVAKVLSGVGDVKFRPGEKVVERSVAQSIVWHPTERKVIVLDVPAFGWKTLVMGGIDEGEDWVDGAKREIYEETGYKNAEFIGWAGQELWSEFWAIHKNENRIAHFRGMEFKLKNLEKDEIASDEADKHEICWMEPEEAVNQFKIPEPNYFLRAALGEFEPFSGEGKIINSGEYDGMDSAQAREKITAKFGKEHTNYRMRDWSVSRQRYWGAPIPIIHCPKCGPQIVADKDLPVVLPELENFEPSGDGRGALARATDWVKVGCPQCGGDAERDTDTIDTYVDSAWYFLRYLSPHDDKQIFASDIANKWMPVDFYNGGDHATAHMLYARFINRFFAKQGLLKEPEPFKKFLFNGKVIDQRGQLFSKSKGNAPDPLEIVDQGYGADALRTYLMFAAPLDQWVRWDPKGVPGTYRFLSRLWNLCQEFLDAKPSDKKFDDGFIHRTIKKVTSDIETQRYNTAIAAMMAAVNELYKLKEEAGINQSTQWRFALETLTQLVAPFAPFMASELWQQLGHEDSVHIGHWPQWDEALVGQGQVTLGVQVNGKVRAEIVLSPDAGEAEAIAAAKEKVADKIAGQKIKKEIYVPGRVVNLVVG